MHYKSREFSKRNTKSAFQVIHYEFMLPASFENFRHIIYMIAGVFELHDDIMNMIFETIVQHVMKNSNHNLLISC